MNQLNKPKREPLTRTWFLGHGFHPVPRTDYIKNKIIYAHEDDLRFINQYGQVLATSFSPFERDPKNCHGHPVPRIAGRLCHVVRALAFFGERPTYVNSKGEIKPYHCHHLNADKEDHRRANILAWLHPDEHRIADDRQKELQTVVPDGDLHLFSYERLRELQDPRTMSDEQFAAELEALRKDRFRRDPRSTDEIMQAEMTRHMEC